MLVALRQAQPPVQHQMQAHHICVQILLKCRARRADDVIGVQMLPDTEPCFPGHRAQPVARGLRPAQLVALVGQGVDRQGDVLDLRRT